MQPAAGRAPGKVILFGEHAVVYGRPAIAVPVRDVEARAWVKRVPSRQGLTIVSADLMRRTRLRTAREDDPLALVARHTLALAGLSDPDLTVTLRSTIPIASGMGSGAAIGAALVRALAAALQLDLAPEQISALVYQSERIYHGTPSGIDNTVVVYDRPVWFVRGQAPELLKVAKPFTLLVADTGVRKSTRASVEDVRQLWQADPARFEAIFDAIGAISAAARQAIEAGRPEKLGTLLNDNQACLAELTVSAPELETLIGAALQAGALGAKLVGGGRGGNMVALVTPETASAVHEALQLAGATRVLETQVS